ncbi:hypothetical protein V6Z11_D02G212100 [Gossypium hirsutum]
MAWAISQPLPSCLACASTCSYSGRLAPRPATHAPSSKAPSSLIFLFQIKDSARDSVISYYQYFLNRMKD